MSVMMPTYILKEEHSDLVPRTMDWNCYFQFHSDPIKLGSRMSLFHVLQFTKAAAFDSGYSKMDVCIKSIDRHGKEVIY